MTHLRDPTSFLERGCTYHARPGALVIVEDTDVAGALCWPPSDAFTRCNEIYSATVRAHGGDPDIGPRLPTQPRAAGITDVQARIVQPITTVCSAPDEAVCIQALTLAAIGPTAIAAGLTTAAEIEAILAERADIVERPETVITTARIVQAWGRTPRKGATWPLH